MPDNPYTLDELILSGFRAYLEPKTFDFSGKRCLAVFAPNGKGKSGIVDALEFLFSDEGTLERLGVRTIHNNAGITALAHNLAADMGIEPFVKVRFKHGSERPEGKRSAIGLRTRPPVADSVIARFMVEPLVRGHELRRFVEGRSPEDRYKDVAKWLQLGPLVAVQQNLRALRHDTKEAAEDQSELYRVHNELVKKTGKAVTAWDTTKVLAYANGLLSPLDPALSLESLSRTDLTFIKVKERAEAEERQLGLEGLRQIRRAAAVLYEEKKGPGGAMLTIGHLPVFAAAIKAHAVAHTTEATERSAAANAAFNEIWKFAEPLFAEGKSAPEICPICKTTIIVSVAGSAEGIREHIAAHRAELAKYAAAKAALEAAASKVSAARAGLVTALRALSPLLGEAQADLNASLTRHLDAIERWTEGAIPDAAALCASLHKLTVELDASIQTIQDRQGENTYSKALSKIEALIDLADERELAVRKLAQLYVLSEALNAQAIFVSGEIRGKVDALLKTLREPINVIYRGIQGDGAAPIKLELPAEDDTNQQRLNLLIDFAENRPGVPPAGYLSDSQIHSLALALRLAAIRKFNTAAPIIALDDIVTSYDADHRRTIAGMLTKEFTGFQLIVTTHDERFFSYLKDQLGDAHWHYTRITRLDRDYGPRFVDHRVSDEMIEARWTAGEFAANEMRQAEEEWLLGLCREIGADIRIRTVEKAYSYERSELAGALAAFLKSRSLTPPLVPGVNNRFLTSLQVGAVENFGSHFQDGPYGSGSVGDEQTRWNEFKFFRARFACPKCGSFRFKRPFGISKPVCASEGCETQFEFAPGRG